VIKKYWCLLFHRKYWLTVDVTDDAFFEYVQYKCLKCGKVFWDNPFGEGEK